MTVESTDFNPYAPPATPPDAAVADWPWLRSRWLRSLILLQAIVIVGALAVEGYEHESIIGSGPVFAMVGLAITVLAFKHRDTFAVIFGGSAIAFTLLIVFLINYNSWGPPQGDRPITFMSWVYALIALPTSAWLARARAHGRG